MKLNEAIRTLVQTEGSAILRSDVFLNFLNDYNAFEEYPASKFVLRTIIQEGYMGKILFSYDNGSEWQSKMSNYSRELKDSYGFKNTLIDFIISSIEYGLSWIDSMPIITQTTEKTEADHSTSLPSPSGKHFTFKGIEIDGDYNHMVQAMKNLGYVVSEQDYEGTGFKGDFAGVSDCQFYIGKSHVNGMSPQILVIMPSNNSWYSAKADYEKYENLLQKKYGTPRVMHYFEDPYYEGDGYELSGIANGKVTYCSVFEMDLGSVTIMISSSGSVIIAYKDKKTQEAIDHGASLCADADL